MREEREKRKGRNFRDIGQRRERERETIWRPANSREYRARRTANKVTLIAISEIEALCPPLHVSTPGYCYLMAVRDRRDYISRGENERCRSQNTVANHHHHRHYRHHHLLLLFQTSVFHKRGGGGGSRVSQPPVIGIYFRAFSCLLFSRVIHNARFDNVTVFAALLISFFLEEEFIFDKMTRK